MTHNGKNDTRPGSPATHRVLLVSDHAFARLGFRSEVQQCEGFSTCGEASGCDDILQQLEKLRPDVAVIDLSLRNGLGLRLVSEVKQQYPQVRLIVSSMHDEAFYAAQVLSAGAEGYLSDRSDANSFVEALRHVVRGEVYVSQDVAQQIFYRATGKQNGQPACLTSTLTGRELEVFELLGQGHNTKRIAREMGISPHTVETYRERIRVKIDAKDGTDLTFRAIVWSLLHS